MFSDLKKIKQCTSIKSLRTCTGKSVVPFLVLFLLIGIPSLALCAERADANKNGVLTTSIKEIKVLTLVESDKPIFTRQWMHYLLDENENLTNQTALTSNNWRPLTKERLSPNPHPIWTWLNIKNTQPKSQTVVLYNQRPMVNYLDVTIFADGKLLETVETGFYRPNKTKGIFPSVSLSIEPGQTLSILTRIQTFGMIEAGWVLSSEDTYFDHNLRFSLVLGLFIGVMLSLIIYGMVSWYIYRQRQFAMLVGYAFSFLLCLTTINGVNTLIDGGLPPNFWFEILIIFYFGSYLFWIPFTRLFLNSRATMVCIDRILRGFELFFCLAVIWFVFGFWYPTLYKWVFIWMAGTILLNVVVVIAGCLGVYYKLDHAKLFLCGHAVMFTLANVLAVLLQSNLMDDFSQLLLLQLILVACHMLIIAYSLGMIGRRTQRKIIEHKIALQEASRFAEIGQTVGMIVHQWRAPIARLGMQVMELQAYFHQEDNNLFKKKKSLIAKELLPDIENEISAMNRTIDDFTNLFSPNRDMVLFDVSRNIEEALQMALNRINELKVQLVKVGFGADETDSKSFELYGQPSAMTHVITVFLENSLDAFKRQNSSQGVQGQDFVITISLDSNGHNLTLVVEDNGGGVKINHQRAMSSFVSTKGKKHMGLGLSIAKKIIEQRMKGKIGIENTPTGVRFTLLLPQNRIQIFHQKDY